VNNNCLACHSADHILNQPVLSTKAWDEVVLATRRASQLKPKSIPPSRDNGSFPDAFEAREPGQCGIKRSIRVELW
jgi:hypothetical protein